VAGKAEIRRRIAKPGIQIVDIRRIGIGKFQPVADKADPLKCCLQYIQRTGIRRRNAGAAEQVTGKLDGVNDGDQSRSRSLIDVLDRVC